MCGSGSRNDWCPQCLQRFGDQRVPARELDAKQQMDELVMMVRPVGIPMSYRWRRYVELASEITPSNVPSFEAFLHMEGSVEAALARKQGRSPMFVWPPMQPGEEHRHRQRVITQVFGLPPLEEPKE